MNFDGKRLKNARLELGMTLQEVSKDLNITVSGLWRLENNKTTIKATELFRFMEYYNKPMQYFLEVEKEKIYRLELFLNDENEKIKRAYKLLKENVDLFRNGKESLERLSARA